MENAYHIPALLGETIEGLCILPDGIYVDVTFGGGGHSTQILQRLADNGRLFSFDQDIEAYANRPENDNRWQFVHSNFRFLKNFMRYYGVSQIDGLLADLGVSFHHFDTAERGFSFRFNGPLDMRMNPSAHITAADVINNYQEEKLAGILYLYGEMNNSRQVAKAICRAREKQPIQTTDQLTAAVRIDKKDLPKLFQAIRIEVNDELGALQEMLKAAKDLLRPGGRIAVLTYHSLEDRIVKNFFKTGNFEGKQQKDFYGNLITPFKVITGKPIVASEEEVNNNPRSRSAKLRIAEKKQDV